MSSNERSAVPVISRFKKDHQQQEPALESRQLSNESLDNFSFNNEQSLSLPKVANAGDYSGYYAIDRADRQQQDSSQHQKTTSLHRYH